MAGLDVKKAQKSLYAPAAASWSEIDVPPMRFLMIDGAGDPTTAPAYKDAVEALFVASYALKFLCKREHGLDYVVPPLEGLWRADDMAAFAARRKDVWKWTMMIRVPDPVPPGAPRRAIEQAARKKKIDGLSRIRDETLVEGRCLQILHVGSYDDEAPTLARLHGEIMPTRGLTFAGDHHEIYLSDARKTAPEKLRTILRQPVRPA